MRISSPKLQTPRFLLVVAFIILASYQQIATALPTGAAGCAAGQAAVGGSHLEADDIQQGPLSSRDIKVFINGVELDPNTEFDVPIGVNHVWKVSMPPDSEGFRGYLLRLDGGDDELDTTEALTNIPGMGGTVQVANVCVETEGVGGVTHNSRVRKKDVEGRLRLDETGSNLNLDVTVVLNNRNGLSQFYYSHFILNAVEAEEEEEEEETATTTPTSESTSSPTMPSTEAYYPIDDEMVDEEGDDIEEEEAAATVTMAPTLPPLVTSSPTCTPNVPCGVCQGDCDSARDCKGDLACFERGYWDTTQVPGCSGSGSMGRDYCKFSLLRCCLD